MRGKIKDGKAVLSRAPYGGYTWEAPDGSRVEVYRVDPRGGIPARWYVSVAGTVREYPSLDAVRASLAAR